MTVTVFMRIKKLLGLMEESCLLHRIKYQMAEREPYYGAAADFTVNTDNKTIDEIVQEIISLVME